MCIRDRVEAVVFEDDGAEHDVAGISDESHHKSEQYVKEDKKEMCIRDSYMTAQEAVAYGLIDSVVEKR